MPKKTPPPKDPEGRQYRFEVDVVYRGKYYDPETKSYVEGIVRRTERNGTYGAKARVYFTIAPVKSAITKIKKYYLNRDPNATFDIRVYYVDPVDWHIREDVSGSTHVIHERDDFMDDLRGTLLDR